MFECKEAKDKFKRSLVIQKSLNIKVKISQNRQIQNASVGKKKVDGQHEKSNRSKMREAEYDNKTKRASEEGKKRVPKFNNRPWNKE